MVFPPRLALARTNYSQLYGMYDEGKTYKHRDIIVPYHLLSLAGYIRKRGIEVAIFDGEVTLLNQEQLAKNIIDWKPHFVGLTATTPDVELSIEVCRLIKDYDSSITTIIGGPHASVLPEDVAQYECVDYVVINDGEEPLVQIIEQKSNCALPGFIIARTKVRSIAAKIIQGELKDLTAQPMPAHDLLDYSKYQFTDPTRGQFNTASIMSSRGCPFDCIFCFHHRLLRYRKVDDFISEIEYLYREKDVRYFYVYDDTFLVNKPRAMEISRKIKALDLPDANFQCLTRANLIDPYLVEALREANFVRVSMGFESGSAKILKQIQKGVNKEDYFKACRILTSQEIETRGSFILGHPYETRTTIIETINFAKELDLFHANFNIMTPYPGTQIYEMALKGDGLRFKRPEYAYQWQNFRRWGKAIIETEELSASDLEFFQKEALIEFYVQPKIFKRYQALFKNGNRTRYFYRPLNFAWQKKFGRCIPFWNKLEEDTIVDPG